MNVLKRFFGNRVSDKDTSLLAPVRMQAIGTLTAYLEHRFSARVTLTQVSIAITKTTLNEAMDSPRQCGVYAQVSFFWAGREKRHGREGVAPLPPFATLLLVLGAPGGQVLDWKPISSRIAISNVFGDFIETDFHNEPCVQAFTDQFNKHRPRGFSIMLSGHDSVIWNINPKPEDAHLFC